MELPALLAFVGTALLTPLVILGLRRFHVLDVPNERSSHHSPTPRGGGLAPAAAMLAIAATSSQLGGPVRACVLLAGVGFCAVGLTDDLVGVAPVPRLALLFLVAAAALPWLVEDLGGPFFWQVLFIVGVLVWIVGYANAYNFMDGINGISATQAVVAGVSWYAIGRGQDIGSLTFLGALVLGGALGFAPYNVPQARVFLGDVGAYFFGVVLGVTAVVGLRHHLPPEAVLGPLALYVVDTGTTLIRRISRGERWYLPHRDHIYQRITTILGGSHMATMLIVGVFMVVCSGLGALSLSDSLQARILGDLSLVVVLSIYLVTPRLLARALRREAAFA